MSTIDRLVAEELALENITLRETNAALLDALADLTLENCRLRLVADYRARHNPDLLDLLAEAARYTQRRAA